MHSNRTQRERVEAGGFQRGNTNLVATDIAARGDRHRGVQTTSLTPNVRSIRRITSIESAAPAAPRMSGTRLL